MTTANLLPHIEIEPASQASGTVILLHGLGADGNDFVPFVSELQLPTTLPLRFIFPNAPQLPVTINNGYIMPAWYDIVSMDIHQRADKNGIQASVKELTKFIEHEEARGIPSNKIVLAGFSQGAVIALMAGINFPRPLAGIMALSGYVPEPTPTIHSANQHTPIFMAHGRQDSVVPYMLGLASFDTLKQAGLAANWYSYAMAHSVCATEIHDITSWLGDIYR